MNATEIRQQLCAAITRRSLVMFEYGVLIRVVEPHRFGINSAGHEMLSGWLRAGYSRSDPAGGGRTDLLTDVSALHGVTLVGTQLVITDNISLPSAYAEALRDAIDAIGGAVTISGNAL